MYVSNGPTSGQWVIRLFGALEVCNPTDQSIALSGKKAGELLAYLALHPHQSHSRDKLTSLLWGDSDVLHTRTRLRQEIATLKSLFPSNSDQPPLLLLSPLVCQILPPTKSDAAVFREACATAKQEQDTDRKIRFLAEACDLYRSDLLGEYDALWIVAERARFSQDYEQALRDLAEAYWQERDFAKSEETLHCLLTRNPHTEEDHVSLMRLYAAQRQPTRVLQQYQALERILRDSAGVAPTEGIRHLADTLRQSASQPVSLPLVRTTDSLTDNATPSVERAMEEIEEPDQAPLAPLPSATSPFLRSVPADNPRTGRLYFAGLLSLLVALLALSAGLWRWKRPSPAVTSATPAPIALMRHTEQWTYLYAPRLGEKPNAEGCAIAADATGFYVTGFIRTDKEDVDILTLKLSPAGKLLWVARYSSPEHDCDRAFSISVDERGYVFVAGETYVPEASGKPGGWHLTLLRYDRNGHRLWTRRSPLPTRNEGYNVRVDSDTQGGCYLGGTALVGGKQSMLLLRYDSAGQMLWQKTLRNGARSTFSHLVVSPEGLLTACGGGEGKARQSGVNQDWMVACLDQTGRVKWLHAEDGPAHGYDMASRIAQDRGGNIYASGVFSTGAPSQAGQGLHLGVVKYRSDGTRIWQRIVKDSGPTSVWAGLSLDHAGGLAVGGTEQQPDGNLNIVLARYDDFGNLRRTWRYAPPAGYRCAALHTPIQFDSGETQIIGRLTTGNARAMEDHSSLLFAQFSPKGQLLKQSLFDTGAYAPTRVNDVNTLAGFIVTGQAGLTNGQGAFMVLHY